MICSASIFVPAFLVFVATVASLLFMYESAFLKKRYTQYSTIYTKLKEGYTKNKTKNVHPPTFFVLLKIFNTFI